MSKSVIQAVAISFLLTGCGMIGPPAITAGRNYYNEVIHDTSAEQLLLNMVRAENFETVSFVDVSEADATVSFAGGVTGGAGGIGARAGTSGGTLAGDVGSVSGTFQYGDSALVRFVPVMGFPLIQQVSSPIAPDSIVRLFNSDFALASVMEFAVDRAAPGYADSTLAKDRMTVLDLYGSIILSSEKNGENAKQYQKTSSNQQGTAAADQNLVLRLQDRAPRDPRGSCAPLQGDLKRSVNKLWAGLTGFTQELRFSTQVP